MKPRPPILTPRIGTLGRSTSRATLSSVRSEMTVEGFFENGLELVHGDFGDEAEAAHIDAEDRHVGPFDEPRDAEQRPVAAEHDDEIGLLRHLLLAARARAVFIEAGLDQHVPFFFLQPRHEPADHLGGFRLFVFCDQTDDADHFSESPHDLITAKKIMSTIYTERRVKWGKPATPLESLPR